MAKLFAPNGRPIAATRDLVWADAPITNEDITFTGQENPLFEFDYAGGSTVHWDTQKTFKVNGERMFVDEDGEIWRERELELRDDD